MPNGNSLAESKPGEAENLRCKASELLVKRFSFCFPAALGLGKGHSPFLLV